jgi:hypothetical protein
MHCVVNIDYVNIDYRLVRITNDGYALFEHRLQIGAYHKGWVCIV